MVGLFFVLLSYMARVKAYIYRYRFFVPILQLSTVAALISKLKLHWYQVNQSIIYETFDFLLFGINCHYSFNRSYISGWQYPANPIRGTFKMNYLSMLFNDLKKVLNNSTDKLEYSIYVYRGVVFKWQRVTDFDYSLSDATRKCNYLRKIKNNHIFKVDYSY